MKAFWITDDVLLVKGHEISPDLWTKTHRVLLRFTSSILAKHCLCRLRAIMSNIGSPGSMSRNVISMMSISKPKCMVCCRLATEVEEHRGTKKPSHDGAAAPLKEGKRYTACYYHNLITFSLLSPTAYGFHLWDTNFLWPAPDITFTDASHRVISLWVQALCFVLFMHAEPERLCLILQNIMENVLHLSCSPLQQATVLS